MERSFPYANSIVKIVEQNILTRRDLLGMAQGTLEQFQANLVAANYGGGVGHTIDELIASQWRHILERFDELNPDPELLKLLRFDHDAINIKLTLKAHLFGLPLPKRIPGNIDLAELDAFCETHNPKVINRKYRGIFTELQKLKGQTPQIVSQTIDQAVYQYLLNASRRYHALYQYFQLKVDSTNILLVERSRLLNYERDYVKTLIISGGKLSQSALFDLEHLDDVAYPELAKLLKVYFSNRDLSKLENALTSLQIQYWKQYSYDSFNFGPLAYYYLKRHGEALNIKRISEGVSKPEGLLEY